MKLNRDFHELLECFARNDVRYLVVGGWALAAHGVPRLTKDLDLWVWPESANAAAVVRSLEEFGVEFTQLLDRTNRGGRGRVHRPLHRAGGAQGE